MELFWTKPSTDEATPTDPLGLDSMRDELADKLVPCLTGRTRSHEDFYWCLTFIQWASTQPTEKERVSRFLVYERWLKLCWANQTQAPSFSGSRRAIHQALETGAPHKVFVPLLKNQRSQGLLGAHLQPLRKLGLVCPAELKLTDVGSRLIEGAGSPILEEDLPDGAWIKWHARFEQAKKGFQPSFKRELQKILAQYMPQLPSALAKAGWRSQQAWTQIANCLSPKLSPFARLAGEFIEWADQVTIYFESLRSGQNPKTLSCPPKIKTPIPTGLSYWEPFQTEFHNWSKKTVPMALARIHQKVFRRRNYSDSDLWVQTSDGELRWRKHKPAEPTTTEGSDCRWSNAVALLKPIRKRV